MYYKKPQRLWCCNSINGKVKSFADNSGDNGITLCTSVENHKARALYEKLNDKIGDQFVYYFLKTR